MIEPVKDFLDELHPGHKVAGLVDDVALVLRWRDAIGAIYRARSRPMNFIVGYPTVNSIVGYPTMIFIVGYPTMILLGAIRKAASRIPGPAQAAAR